MHSISCVPTSCHDYLCLKSQSCGWCKTCVPFSLHILDNICDSWFTPWRTVVYQKVSVAAISLLGCRWGVFAADLNQSMVVADAVERLFSVQIIHKAIFTLVIRYWRSGSAGLYGWIRRCWFSSWQYPLIFSVILRLASVLAIKKLIPWFVTKPVNSSFGKQRSRC